MCRAVLCSCTITRTSLVRLPVTHLPPDSSSVCLRVLAVQCINKKLVKVKSALDNVLEERNVLTMMKSHFVTNLKYGLQDDDTLYLIMDLMLGGDLKFHLINAGRFTEKRARFYAAQVLLGLEHVHKLSIIYRDMKVTPTP